VLALGLPPVAIFEADDEREEGEEEEEVEEEDG
jgi:hypothetical protein